MTEMTSVGTDLKICKVCSPTAKTPCRLASTSCPYRDIDTQLKSGKQ